MKKIKLLNFELNQTACLAPMAGVADTSYRTLCAEMGAVMTISEMISAKGLCYDSKGSAELCRITPEERPMGLQLFGSEPEFIAKAVNLLQEYQPDWIDLNMGCPVPKVVNTGAGSAVMKNPKLAGELVAAAVKSAGNVPVTAKIRSGWDNNCINAVETAKYIEDAGAAAVAVHGRTREQFYGGTADLNVIKAVKNAISIPVIGNGDVNNAQSCINMYNQTGCDLVMIGRGSYGNPFVFREINAYLNGENYSPPTLEEKMQVMLEHIRLILELSPKNEELAMHEARKHAAWYMNGYYGSAKFRGRCYQLDSYDEAERLAEEFVDLQRSRGN